NVSSSSSTTESGWLTTVCTLKPPMAGSERTRASSAMSWAGASNSLKAGSSNRYAATRRAARSPGTASSRFGVSFDEQADQGGSLLLWQPSVDLDLVVAELDAQPLRTDRGDPGLQRSQHGRKEGVDELDDQPRDLGCATCPVRCLAHLA